jgi:hypothetical protein
MKKFYLSLVIVALCTAQFAFGPGASAQRSEAAFNSNPQLVPFSQAWTNVNLITITDDWGGMPGIIG